MLKVFWILGPLEECPKTLMTAIFCQQCAQKLEKKSLTGTISVHQLETESSWKFDINSNIRCKVFRSVIVVSSKNSVGDGHGFEKDSATFFTNGQRNMWGSFWIPLPHLHNLSSRGVLLQRPVSIRSIWLDSLNRVNEIRRKSIILLLASVYIGCTSSVGLRDV